MEASSPCLPPEVGWRSDCWRLKMAKKRDGKASRGGKYRIDLSPPTVAGSSVKPKITAKEERPSAGRATEDSVPAPPRGYSSISSELLYRYDKEISELKQENSDLKKRVRTMERELKSLRDEFDRISNLIEDLSVIKSEMKDMVDIVEELSSLYDLISADINPFIETRPLKDRNGELDGADDEELVEVLEEEDEEIERDELILQWVTFLTKKVGKGALPKVISHYLKLGWIDEELSERALQIAQGLPGKMRSNPESSVSWQMDPEDHRKSLEYIKRIREVVA
ncbi:MAG: hypothetical protein DRN42_01600 [Thermoplasmata archaeon]|nr:MAG: hypothetical protein DRN42_01600 [Thermoplasmata archaeon]